jgi:hypothetical protein
MPSSSRIPESLSRLRQRILGPASNLRVLTAVFSGSLLASMIGFVASLLQARLVAPSDLGILRLVGIPLGYMIWLHLGVYDGIIRELPFWIGKGDKARAYHYASVAQGWNLLLSAAAGAVFLALSVSSLMRGDYPLAAAWATQVVAATSAFYCDFYLAATYRMGVDFARLAWFRTVQSIASLALVALIPVFHFYGICLRAALVALVGIGLLHHYRPLRVQPAWSWPDLRHLVRIGLPSSLVGYVFSALWVTVEATLVFRHFGVRGLGLYSVTQTAITAIAILPESVCFFYWPRMSERFGQTASLAAALRMTYIPVVAMLAGSVPILAVAWHLCGPAVSVLLPQYVDAIPLLQWGTLVATSRILAPPLFAFFVVRKQYYYAIAGACGFGIYYLILQSALTATARIEIFPQTMVVGRVAMTLAGYGFLWHLVRRETVSVSAAS